MKTDSPKTLLGYSKKFASHIGLSSFLVFQIVTIILLSNNQNEVLISIYANPLWHMLLVLGLIEWGYFSAERTVTEYIKNTENVSKFAVIATPLFIQMTLVTDLVYFSIGTWAPFEQHLMEPVQKQLLHEKIIQAQLFSIIALCSSTMYFYGNRIWKVIRQRDLLEVSTN